MAFIADTAFEARITNGEFDALCNVTGKYQASSADADCSAGLLCVRTTQMPCEGFTGIYNENAWIMNAATASVNANDVIYACDPYDAQLISNGTNNYYIGTRTLGLGIPAGEYGTFKRIVFDGQHVYRFGVGNLTAELSTNTVLKPAANGLLTPAAAAPTAAGSVYFEVRGSGNFTEGTSDSFGYVDAVAKTVVVATA